MKLTTFTRGIFQENPTFVMMLGMCPTLGVTTSAINGLGMGISTMFVLVMSNMTISLLKNWIDERIRIPAFILIIASFVTTIDMLLHAYLPTIHQALGIFIPLIVVNCIILGRAEAFACKSALFPSILDGLGMGTGLTIALFLIGSIRQFLGEGAIFKYQLFTPIVIFILPPGAFLVLGYLIVLIKRFTQ